MKQTTKLLPLFAFAVSLGSYAAAEGFTPLCSLQAKDIELAAENIQVPVPQVPVNIAKTDQQLLNKFDALKRDLVSLGMKTDSAKYEMSRLTSEAMRIAQTGGSHLSFQSDLMRVSTDLTRYISDVRNMVYAVTNIVPLAQKDRELNLRALDMQASARSMLDLPVSSDRLEQAVRSVPSETIGYTAAIRAREISRQSDELTGYAEQVYEKTQELVKNTKP
ncbi:MAG: hypothetical protein WCK76_11665 [Elusimicrobiota bacterium]